MEKICPHCGAQIEVSDLLADALVDCPVCGAPLEATRSEIIDVVPVRVDRVDRPGDDEPADPFFDAFARGREGTGPRVYNMEFERMWRGGPSCCSLGCIVLVIFFALALKGLISLFN
ncbi:MAG: hypothetical protein IT368_12940 [Candidatus Hydrogenedentes bacterium]|nr:hypothetical protein [Candidatus Hydrogenedentota bacterium]